MDKLVVQKENYDKFIFKGSLALETYSDITHKNSDLIDEFNQKLKKYRQSINNSEKDKEIIVNMLISTIEKIGIKNFIIYADGDIVYNDKVEMESDYNVR